MKILRIRLLNLNSLRGEHVVDFEHGPLARGGLFLIAGPTGAGKSTLLDALTLALYGRAARYAKEPNPADMMTRLGGECRAEVEFEVGSGRYRAEWQLRRARGKPDGAIQPARRYIYDAQGQALTQHVRDADETIEKLVGLDYQRFLRSVLLAQGEFARFLRANPDERAELLESLTGTGIYGELSRLAHEETTRREAALADREKDLSRVALLTAEQREELSRRIGERETARTQQRAELEKLNHEAAQARELGGLLERERALLAEQGALERRAQAAEADLARLARHRLALPYAEDLSRLDAADQRRGEEARGLRAARGVCDQARREWLTALLGAADFAAALVRQGKETVSAAETQVQAADTQRQQAAEWLKRHGSDGSLGAGLPDLAIQLRTMETTRNDLVKGRTRADTLATAARQQTEKITTAVNALERAVAIWRVRESEKAAAGQKVESLLAGKTFEAREREIEALRAQVEALDKVILVEESAREKWQAIEANRQLLDELTIKIEQTRKTVAEALAKKEAAEHGLALRQDHLQKARLMASLEEHRAALKPGEPCPLCGATEHPFADPERVVISESTLETEVRRAREALTAAERDWRAADRCATRLTSDHANRGQTLGKDAAEWETLRARANSLAAANAIEAASLDRLRLAKALSGDRVKALVQECAGIREAKQAFDQLETARVQAENQSRLAEQDRAAAQGLLAQCQAQMQEQADTNAGLDQRLAATSQSLAALLQPYGLTAPEPGREPVVLQQLTQRRKDFQEREESLRQAQATLEQARHSVERAKQTLEALEHRIEPLIAEARPHATEPDLPAPAARAALAASWTSPEHADQAVRVRAAGLARAEEAVAQRQQGCELATAALERATLELEARLASSAFPSSAALRAARLAPEEAGRMDRLDLQLRREADSLQARLKELHERVHGLRAARVAEGDAVPELAARLRALQHATEELAAGIRLDQEALARDQAERERQAALAAALERERGRVLVWQRLHGLIGSHDGRKFRRFAQGLSLDVPVEHANRHLARLTDRYLMRRRGGEELELEIEDLYQAGVTRPMASLSGGESFLASLALALGLAALAGRSVRIDSLFIDEGFGSLDSDTLDSAISALETLRQDAKTVGVVSHVNLLKERITTQILVEKGSAGASSFRIIA